VTDSNSQSTISRWSVAAAVFGAVSNLLLWILSNYQSYYLAHYQYIWSYSSNIGECISLAPLLVLFIFRNLAPVIFLYALALFSLLIGRVYDLIQYHKFGAVALAYKIDSANLLLPLLGGVSLAVVLAWATIRFLVLVRHALKSDGPTS
jgi:hypothetical protein